jgi:hypothetical protein
MSLIHFGIILATYYIVARRLLWLTYEARLAPELLSDTVLEANQWHPLCATINKYPIPPKNLSSLQQSI